MRASWSVGSVIEVYSSSASKWYIAQVAKVGENASAHMITVQFVGDNGQIMQKSMPRSDMQLATFGRNTRQMPPNFQKVASESRPGQFSYQDSASGTKYQTKELAWQNYYLKVLKCEQAQQLLAQQQQQPPQPQPQAQAPPAADLQRPPTMQLAPPPAPKADGLSSNFYAGAHGPDPVLAQTWKDLPVQNQTPQYATPVTAPMLNGGSSAAEAYYSAHASQGLPPSRQSFAVSGVPAQIAKATSFQCVADARPQTVNDLASMQPQSGLKPSTPFPGYGQSFAVGKNAGYESYLASQGLA
jgi:hypothetical protein